MTPGTFGLESLKHLVIIVPNHFRLRRHVECTALIGSDLLRPFLAEEGIFGTLGSSTGQPAVQHL
jgi:hypothetical protein